MSENFMRAYCDQEQIRAGKPGEPIRFVISTPGVKRDGKNLPATKWSFENYRKNPVVLWAHDYRGENLPIGRGSVGQENGITFADVSFDPEDGFAQKVDGKYRRGYLNAVSVGWGEIEIDGQVKLDLLDISAVPVPGDPDALIQRQIRALEPYIKAAGKTPENDSGALRPHSSEIGSDENWDPGEEWDQAPSDQLRSMFAWADPDHESDPQNIRMYKYLHHNRFGEVVWRGVADCMIRLFHVTIEAPDEDRRGIYHHLARHYEQFGKTPPEFRTGAELEALEPQDIRGLFLEGELGDDPGEIEAIAALQLIKLKLY